MTNFDNSQGRKVVLAQVQTVVDNKVYLSEVDGKIGDDAASVKALQTQLSDLDAKMQKLLARPACEPPKPPPMSSGAGSKPAAVASKPAADLGVATP